MAQPQVKSKLEVNEEMDQNTILLAPDGEARLELREDGFLALVNVNNKSIIASNKFHGPKDTYKIKLSPFGQLEEFDSMGSIVWSGGKKHLKGPRYYFCVSNMPAASVYKAETHLSLVDKVMDAVMKFLNKAECRTMNAAELSTLTDTIFKP